MTKPRHRVRFWAMAAGSAVFTLLGLVLVVLGPDADARRTGVMCLLLFGLGPAGYLGGPLLTRRGPGSVELGRAGSEAAFVFPAPRAKRLAQLAGAVGLAGGTLLLYLMRGGWVLAVCAIVFGLFLLLALYRMLRPLRLMITPTRVLVGSSEIRWEAIDDVDLYEMPAGQTTVDMVGIDAKDPDQIVRPRWMALVGRLGRGLSAYDLVMPADGFAGAGEEVVEALKAYKRDARRRRLIGAEQERGRLLGELWATVPPA